MKKLFNSLKIIGIAAVLAVGVSYVSAFTRIPNTPVDNPSENTPEFVTVGGPLATFQTKLGALSTESFFKSGDSDVPNLPGLIVASNDITNADRGGVTSLWQFFQKEYLPGTKSQMKVGSAIPARSTNPLPSVDKTKFNPNDTAIPLTIDLMDRGTANNSAAGTQVMNLLASNSCNATSTIQTNTPGVQFWSTKNGANADVIAGGIQIGDSTAGDMKVLVATDDKGNAEWGTMSVEGGRIIVDYPSKATGNNIVKYGQYCSATYRWTTLWSGCKYFDDTAVGNGYVEDAISSVCKDSNGNTVSNSLCPQPVPESRQAASSLPLCTTSTTNSCLSYQLKANCHGNQQQFSTVYVPNGCVKMGETATPSNACALGAAQEIYTVQCSTTLTDVQVSNGAAAAGYPSTHLSPVSQTPGQCVGQLTAWTCHTVGGGPGTIGSWVTAESRGGDITCTSPYLPQLLPGEAFSEGEVVCAENRPAASLCRALVPGGKSTCNLLDSVCPN